MGFLVFDFDVLDFGLSPVEDDAGFLVRDYGQLVLRNFRFGDDSYYFYSLFPQLTSLYDYDLPYELFHLAFILGEYLEDRRGLLFGSCFD